MTDHSQLPWRVREWVCHAPTSIVVEHDGRTLHIAECAGLGEHSDLGIANAALIVQAVNERAALIAERDALRAACAYALGTVVGPVVSAKAADRRAQTVRVLRAALDMADA